MHPPTAPSAHRHPPALGRALAVVVACAVLALLLSSDVLFGFAERLLAAADRVIAAHPAGGLALFVVVSALSAMLAFFSSAVLVPVAVLAWGPLGTIALLWVAWIVGGLASYAIGRYVGLPLVRRLVPARQIAAYRARFTARATFPIVLLLQLALPSEVPGYLLGLGRVRVGIYLSALALAELPFAVGTVLLGKSIVERRLALLIGLGVVAALAGLGAIRLLHRRLER